MLCDGVSQWIFAYFRIGTALQYNLKLIISRYHDDYYVTIKKSRLWKNKIWEMSD